MTEMKIWKPRSDTSDALQQEPIFSNAPKTLLAALLLFVSISAPDRVLANCDPFSVPEDLPLAAIVTEIFESDLEGNQRQPGSFTEVWAKYTLDPVSEPANLLVQIALGYRANEGGFHAAALSSFENAYIQVNDSSLCESKLLHFVIFAGRADSTLAVMEGNSAVMSRPVLGSGTYRTVTSNLNRPEPQLVSSDLELIVCLVTELSMRANLAELDQSIDECKRN